MVHFASDRDIWRDHGDSSLAIAAPLPRCPSQLAVHVHATSQREQSEAVLLARSADGGVSHVTSEGRRVCEVERRHRHALRMVRALTSAEVIRRRRAVRARSCERAMCNATDRCVHSAVSTSMTSSEFVRQVRSGSGPQRSHVVRTLPLAFPAVASVGVALRRGGTGSLEPRRSSR